MKEERRFSEQESGESQASSSDCRFSDNARNCKILLADSSEGREFDNGNGWDSDDSLWFLDGKSLAERNGKVSFRPFQFQCSMVYILFSWQWCHLVPYNMPRSHCCRQCKWVLPFLCILSHYDFTLLNYLIILCNLESSPLEDCLMSMIQKSVDLKRMQYMVIISVLLLLEATMAVDILLNSDWEKDLPEDPTGKFHDFKEFVKSNFDICRWIGLVILLGQGLSILLAMALRALEQNQCCNYDSDEDFPPGRLPLINHDTQPPAYVVGDPQFASKKDAWNTSK